MKETLPIVKEMMQDISYHFQKLEHCRMIECIIDRDEQTWIDLLIEEQNKPEVEH